MTHAGPPESESPPLLADFGEFGGRYVAETLMPAVEALARAWPEAWADPAFQAEYRAILRDYVGRPSPISEAPRLALACGGGRIFFKREDLNHTGSHKINNSIGQVLLARRMGKTRIIAETGAGQHGVATATACAYFGLPCVVYMGAEDVARQALNVVRMRLLGAEVIPVSSGSATLKDAINAALRDWVASVENTHYVIGSVMGPDPYPVMVRELQRVIGEEARAQMLERIGRLPDAVVACVGGGSNAMGIFAAFVPDKDVQLIGVEATGEGIASGRHAATMSNGAVGVYHGMRSLVLQNDDGQLQEAHSISAGLDYPGVGPEHAHLRAIGRARYLGISDAEALAATALLSRTEGIIPALETAHAIAALPRIIKDLGPEAIILVNLSGRGDKDMHTVMSHLDPGALELVKEAERGRDAARAAVRGATKPPRGVPMTTTPSTTPVDRIAARFAAVKAEGRAALVAYLTSFDPDRQGSLDRLCAACEAGIDVLELGVPFSDPAADGPTIQAAMVRALAAGSTLAASIDLAGEVRRRFDIPIVLFSYGNPLMRLGPTALTERCVQAGLDGLLAVDLPPEHSAPLRDPAAAAGLRWIGLIAPTTTPRRRSAVLASASGFIYAVSLTGVTGAPLDPADPALHAGLAELRAATSLPVVVGFGVRSGDDVRALARSADGVVVGSALVEAGRHSPEALGALVKDLRAATHPR